MLQLTTHNERFNSHRQPVLVVLLVLLFLTSTTASASLCCADIESDTNPNPTTLEIADAPCHGNASGAIPTGSANIDQEKQPDNLPNTQSEQCCASCLLLAVPLLFTETTGTQPSADINASIAQLISKHPAQPFRPPINNLA